jgi:hypothetical protein
MTTFLPEVRMFFIARRLRAFAVSTLLALLLVATAVHAQTNYYTYQSGGWATATTWTTDPSGITSIGAAVPTTADNVFILNGYTVTTDGANQTCASLTVNTGGALFINNASFANHNFGTVSGQGTIRTVTATIGGTANYTNFLGASGGTFQFENTANFTLPGGTGNTTIGGTTVTQYRNLALNLNAVGTIATMNQGTLTINGNLTITQGTFQINDATTRRCTLTVNNDVNVAANGRIRVGTGNPLLVDLGIGNRPTAGTNGYSLVANGGTNSQPSDGYYHAIFHQFNIGGNFTNNGSVRFTNQTTRRYNQFAGLARDNSVIAADQGAVTVVFTGSQNNTVTCNGVTDFYNLVVNKGVDRTYVLTVNSSNFANFELWGPVTAGQFPATGTGTSQWGTVTESDPEMRKSLYVRRGTIQLVGSLRIYTMSENPGTNGDITGDRGDYAIGENSAIWVNGATVYATAHSGDGITPAGSIGIEDGGGYQATTVYGTIRISAGYFSTRNSAGLVYWAVSAAQIIVEGGVLDFSQFWRAGGGTGSASYLQSNGVVYARGGVNMGASNPGSQQGGDYFARLFDIDQTTTSFIMTGGVLALVTDGAASPQMRVLSSTANINVTGSGKITALMADGMNIGISSTAPLPKLEIIKRTGTGNATVTLFANTTIVDSLAINDNTTLNAAGFDLSVGGSFRLGTAGSASSNAVYTSGTNTTTLAGSSNTSLALSNNTATPAITFNNLAIAKTGGVNADSITVRSPGRAAGNTTLSVTGNLTVTNGDLNTLNYRADVQGNIVNNDTITNTATGTVLTNGNILLTGTGAQTLSGTSGVYGSVQINKTGGSVTLGSNMTLTGGLSLASATVLNAATFGVTLASPGGLIYGNAGGTAFGDFGATRMIQFNGNDSDGGVTYGGTGTAGLNADGTRFFPVGVAAIGSRAVRYAPANLIFTRTGTSGTLRVNPATEPDNAKLPTLNGTYATNNAYSLYFRIRTTGFSACTLSTSSVLYFPASDNTSGSSDASWVTGRVWIPISGSSATRQDLSGSITWNTTPNPGTATLSAAVPLNTASLGDSRITVGVAANFTGSPLTFYSRVECYTAWTTNTTWNRSDLMTGAQLASPHQAYTGTSGSGSTEGVDFPGANSIVYIGFNPSTNQAHGVFHETGANINAAEVHFTNQATKGGCDTWIDRPFFEVRGGNPVVSFGLVEGNGVFAVGPDAANSPQLNNIDFGDFANKVDAIFLIQGMSANGTAGAGNGTWPLNIAIPGLPTTFPNLRTYAGAYQSATYRFTGNFTVNYNMLMEGGTRFLLGDGTTNPTLVTVNGDINFSVPTSGWGDFHAPRIVFQNTGNATTLQVNGNINFNNNFPTAAARVDSSQIVVEGGGTTTLVHTLRVAGNITNASGTTASQGITLFTTAASAKGNLELFGSTNATVSDAGTGNSAHNVNRIIVNKGTTQATTATFTKSVQASGDATDVNNRPLTLQSGTAIFNYNAANATTYTLTAGGDYTIPQTAGLTVGNNTTVQFGTGLATATNLILNGALTINGGTVNLLGNGTAEHSITYGSAAPIINISSGALNVGGQIRQPTISATGNLNYTQSGGTVTVGSNVAPVNDRGVFEIDNVGSAFNMSAGTLQLVRPSTGQTRPAFWMNPGSTSVTGGTIQFGSTSPATPASTVFQVYSSAALPNVVVNTTNGPTARVVTLPLSVANLTVQGGATFDAATNLQNVNISGDLTVNATGTYNANSVTTTFNRNASSNQTITNSGTMTFGSLTMNRSAGFNLVAASGFTVNQNLTLTQGSFQTGTNTITILGNVTNNAGTSGHVSGTSGGLLLQGSVAQNIGGTGTFGRVTINNTQGVVATGDINVDGAAAANATFTLTNGIMALGSNFFNLSGVAQFAGTFSSTRMVTTSGSGVGGFRKTFTGPITSYQIPLGVGTLYTPVTINFPSTSGGTFTITSVNSITPAAVSPFNVINYYWLVTASGFTSGSGTLVAQWPATINSPNFATNYVPAQLQTAIATPGWVYGTTGDVTSGDPRTATFNFPSPGDANALTGQYTVGQTASLPAPPTYTTTGPGNWETQSTWTPTPPVGGPQGALVVLNHNVTVTTLNRNALNSTINVGGTLNVGTTVGHNFGNISGNGSIVVQPSGGSGLIPAGNYGSYTGTFSFTGAQNFTLIGTTLGNNWPSLTHSGTGTMTLQSGTINVANALTVGSSGNIDLATNNSQVALGGNLVRSGTGGFNMNASTYITLNGTGAQNINTGAAPGLTLNNLRMNKASGATTISAAANSPLNISNNLDFVSGIITTTSNNLPANQALNFTNTGDWTINGAAFSFANLSNCSPSSYVNGSVMKTTSGNTSFTFPTGNSTAGPGPIPFRPVRISGSITDGQWVATYYNSNHPNSANTVDLGYVLTTREWWQINGPNGGSANVTTYWGCNSATGTASQSEVDNNYRVTNFTGSNWVPVASSKDLSSTPSTGSVTTTSPFGFSIQTFGVASTFGAPLPVSWLYFNARNTAEGIVTLNWATATELNNDRFEIERSLDGVNFTRIGTVLGNGTTQSVSVYTYNDLGLPANATVFYYRLKQVDYDGAFDYSVIATVNLKGQSANSSQWNVGPNPFPGGDFNLMVVGSQVDWQTDVHIVSVVNAGGTVVKTMRGTLLKVRSEVAETLNGLPPGVYFLRVESGQHNQMFKIVRQ